MWLAVVSDQWQHLQESFVKSRHGLRPLRAWPKYAILIIPSHTIRSTDLLLILLILSKVCKDVWPDTFKCGQVHNEAMPFISAILASVGSPQQRLMQQGFYEQGIARICIVYTLLSIRRSQMHWCVMRRKHDSSQGDLEVELIDNHGHSKELPVLHSDMDRREFICAGAAAGIAVSKPSPWSALSFLAATLEFVPAWQGSMPALRWASLCHKALKQHTGGACSVVSYDALVSGGAKTPPLN